MDILQMHKAMLINSVRLYRAIKLQKAAAFPGSFFSAMKGKNKYLLLPVFMAR